MPKITPGNRLYLYQLLSRELGAGRQTLLPRAEEVLAADGLCPADLGCETMRELCEQLREFIKLTVFKKGYVYATVLPNEEYDRALEAQAKGAEKDAAAAGKPWKRRKGAKALKPVRPRHVERVAEPEPAVEAEVEAVAEPVDEPAPEAEAAPVAEEAAAEPEVEAIAEPAAEVTPAPEEEAEQEPETTPEPEAAPEPASHPSISLTITYVPEQAADAEEPAAARAHSDLPHDFHRDVRCPDEQLSRLYQVLPPDVDPLATLEEDFRVARSTGAVEGTRSSATFSLRYLRPDGTAPVTVTLRRSARPVAGKHWAVAEVELGEEREVGLDGLDEVDRGAWSAFPEAPGSRDPERAFAQAVAIGSWDEALERLALLAAPESWGPGRRYLRDYLTMTFARVQSQQALAVSANDGTADFDTGLLTASGEPVHANLVGTPGDIPWRLEGFSTSGAARPVSYARTLAEVAFDAGLPAPELEARAALERNPRLASAAYDPLADEVRLLVPAGGHALALAVTERGYEPLAELDLEHAYACARVVSSEQPSWLTDAARER